MILKRTCPHCGEETESELRVNRFGVPFYACNECGVITEDRQWYRCPVNEAQLQWLMQKKPEGRFVYDSGSGVVGIKIGGGELQYEEFPDEPECLKWLAREGDAV